MFHAKFDARTPTTFGKVKTDKIALYSINFQGHMQLRCVNILHILIFKLSNCIVEKTILLVTKSVPSNLQYIVKSALLVLLCTHAECHVLAVETNSNLSSYF